MQQKKCLIVDAMHDSLFSMLAETDWAFDYAPDMTRDEIKKIIHAYGGLIIRSKTRVDQDLLGATPSLKFIGRAGAGIDNLDEKFLREKSIEILHAAEGNRDAVGEYCVGALLSLMRNIPRADREVRNKVWLREENRGEELMGKTVGIIGYGNMGRAFAKRISGFQCKVLAYDKYKSDFSDEFATASPMDDLFEQTDILSIHIPLTTETRGFIDFEYLNRFKKDIILVNSSRGEIVPLAALVQGLEHGKLRGAVLDVLENEKLATLTPAQADYLTRLADSSSVILTPHIAGWTYESHVKINVALVEKIKALRF